MSFSRALKRPEPYLYQRNSLQWLSGPTLSFQTLRCLQTSTPTPPRRIPNFAFAFDIDGVLLRSSSPLPNATKTLRTLQDLRIPFILLTNGGGKHERDRVSELSSLLSVPLSTSMFVQSHTPFADLVHRIDKRSGKPLRERPVLVVGGEGDRVRKVAEAYGFQHPITPADIITASPQIWPFTPASLLETYARHARPLPLPIFTPFSSSTPLPTTHLTIASILVFADPRDWALDTQIILDVLLSGNGVLGTRRPLSSSSKATKATKHNATPPIYFSNPDIHWSSSHHLPRLGQGAFQAAFRGVWNAVTHLPLHATTIGKPSQAAFEFAEKILLSHRRELLSLPSSPAGDDQEKEISELEKIYMVGDNPLSDIQGGNTYRSPRGTKCDTILVRSGVFDGADDSQLTHKPTTIVKDVHEGVTWALEREGWEIP
ncbi:MAG: hypothetical protein Q9220_006958 [cf. Caloplaca sp. 1 TL-2023]